MLLSGECEVLGLEEEGELYFVVREPGADPVYASVVGRPSEDAIAVAVAHACEGERCSPFPKAVRTSQRCCGAGAV